MRQRLTQLAICLLAAGCVEVGPRDGPPRPGDDVGDASPLASYVAMPTAQLWSLHRTTSSTAELPAVEAILGRRGQTRNGADFLGARTARLVGVSRYARPHVNGSDDADCAGLPDAATAQAGFLSAGGPVRDPNVLDPDGDGLACGWGARLKAIAGA